jgi:DNA-binding winged helix-turn-helix (wHTH) protein
MDLGSRLHDVWERETYVVADIRIDAGSRQVHRGRDEIELSKLSFDLLLALARAHPDALSTEELIERVWAGRIVSPATVAKRAELLRQSLGDDSNNPRYVCLVRGHGYRLKEAQRIPSPAPEQNPLSGSLVRRGRRWPGLLAVLAISVGAAVWIVKDRDTTTLPTVEVDQNSIAVLPFTAMSGHRDDEYFAEGLTEEISHALANVPGLKVSGRASTFAFKGQDEDPRAIGSTLGVAHEA